MLRANLAISISTHAPAGGATLNNAITGGFATFLLTPLREGRLTHWEMNTERMISTHAPAGGATQRR